MLAYSSVAQAGYLMGGVIVSTQLGAAATVFYLAVYLLMNLAAFAVIIARERETPATATTSTRSPASAARSPLLAWPLTIAMLSLAGIPATAGLHRQDLPDPGARRRRLHVARGRDRRRLDDLARLLPARRRGDLDARRAGRRRGVGRRPSGRRRRLRRGRRRAARTSRSSRVALVFGAATIFFGIVPQPLFELVQHAATR